MSFTCADFFELVLCFLLPFVAVPVMAAEKNIPAARATLDFCLTLLLTLLGWLPGVVYAICCFSVYKSIQDGHIEARVRTYCFALRQIDSTPSLNCSGH